MKCFKCGTELPKKSKFCPKCGQAQGFSEELINGAKNGDQDAISELYNRTYNNVYFTVKALIKSEDTILDIVQDSYVKGFKSLSQLQEPDKFRAWMKKIAHNRAVDYLRKTKPVLFSTMSTENDEIFEFEDDKVENLPEVVIDQKETTRLIQEILDSLNEEQRLVVGMFYYEQMSVKEIAETLGISENTVKSRLSYGRKKIEAQVKELEKKGTKLYSLAPLPFLLLLFKNADAQAAELPNANILQFVQKECASNSGNRPNSAKSGSAKAETAVKTATGTVSKGIVAKIVAGIVAAAVIGGGVAGIIALNKTDESNKVEQTVEEIQENNEEQKTELLSEEIYQTILDEYGAAMGVDPYDENVEFPNINYVMMNYYYQQKGDYDEAYPTGFYYDYYDIDGNGTDELLISYGLEPENIVDVYGIKDNQAHKLIHETSLGERSQLNIYPDGKMILVGSGGANLHSVTVYTFEKDGITLTEDTETFEGQFNLDAVLTEKSGNQVAINTSDLTSNSSESIRLDWKPIDPHWEVAKDKSPKKYIGQYMNGNDWNAGKFTIEENDETTVKVRLEAFKNRSDRELTTVFDGLGYRAKDGLVIEINGKQAKITDSTYGFYFEASPSLKLEWALDPYIYEEEYVAMGPIDDSNTSTQTGTVDLTKYDGYSNLDDNSVGFRLDTADGNLAFVHCIQEYLPPGREKVSGEYPYIMNLKTADISGNTYTIYNMSNSHGDDISFQFFSIKFIFEENKVIMIVDTDGSKFAGGGANIIHSGTYELTKN